MRKNENMSMVKMVTRKTVPKGCFLGGGVIFSKNTYGLYGNTQDSAYHFNLIFFWYYGRV